MSDAQPNPNEEPKEVFFTKDVVSALSNVEPVVDERANPQSSAPQANTEQLEAIIAEYAVWAGNDITTANFKRLKSKLLAWNKATVMQELKKLKENPSWFTGSPDSSWAGEQIEFIEVEDIDEAIAQISKEQA